MDWFYLYRCNGLIVFRLFGVGALFKNVRKHPLLYSQRLKKWDRVLVGDWYFAFLKRWC